MYRLLKSIHWLEINVFTHLKWNNIMHIRLEYSLFSVMKIAEPNWLILLEQNLNMTLFSSVCKPELTLACTLCVDVDSL